VGLLELVDEAGADERAQLSPELALSDKIETLLALGVLRQVRQKQEREPVGKEQRDQPFGALARRLTLGKGAVGREPIAHGRPEVVEAPVALPHVDLFRRRLAALAKGTFEGLDRIVEAPGDAPRRGGQVGGLGLLEHLAQADGDGHVEPRRAKIERWIDRFRHSIPSLGFVL
jgi:hypothetical protein